MLSTAILQYLGLWRTKNDHGLKLYLNILHSYFTAVYIYFDVFFEAVELISSYTSFQQFLSRAIIFLTMAGNCGKVFNVLLRRKEILELLHIFETHPCRCQDAEEKKIQDKFDKKIKYRSLAFLIVTESVIVTTVSVSIVHDTPNRGMFYDTYLPFDSSTIGYWSSYVFQIFAHVFGSLVSVAYDTLIPGLILKICAQLSILEHRLDLVSKDVDSYHQLTNAKKEKLKEVTECVKHHLQIIQLAERTNKVFSVVMLLQFSVSTIVICITIYTLSQVKISDPEFAAMAIYFLCMTAEIFGICIASTECNIKSVGIATAIYQSNWYNLDIDSRKSLLLIMTRSSKPLKFNAAYFIEVSLSSYNQLMKLSYSAYNVLS